MQRMVRKGFLPMGSICLDLQLLAVIIHQCATIWHVLEIGHAWDPRTLQDQSMSDPQAHRHTGTNPPTQSYSFLASKCCQFSLHSIHLWNSTQHDDMFECKDITHWRTKHILAVIIHQCATIWHVLEIGHGWDPRTLQDQSMSEPQWHPRIASMWHDLICSRNSPRLRS